MESPLERLLVLESPEGLTEVMRSSRAPQPSLVRRIFCIAFLLAPCRDPPELHPHMQHVSFMVARLGGIGQGGIGEATQSEEAKGFVLLQQAAQGSSIRYMAGGPGNPHRRADMSCKATHPEKRQACSRHDAEAPLPQSMAKLTGMPQLGDDKPSWLAKCLSSGPNTTIIS